MSDEQMIDRSDRERVDKRFSTKRRSVLSGAAALGLAGVFGTTQPARGAESSDEEDPPWAPDEHDHSGEYGTATRLGNNTRIESVQSAKINSVHHLDPDAEDWGAAVNAALEEMEENEVLRVPPVEYRTETTAVLDKDIVLVGDATGYIHDDSKPKIIKDADIPILEAQDASESSSGRAVQPRVVGLRFGSAVDDTTPGAIFHGTVELDRVTGERLGNDVILLQQRTGLADNLNNSLVQNVSGSFCDGTVVRIENISGAGTNVNAMRIHVRNAFRNNGWGIDAEDGWGNYYSVQVLHGSDDGMSGGIRLNTTRSMARLIYVEPDMDKGIQFDDINNTGQIIHGIEGLEGQGFIDNAGQNRQINLGDHSFPDITKSGIPYTLSGGTSVRGGDVEIVDGESGLVLTAPNGVSQYQLTVDEDGNLTTQQVTEYDHGVPKQSLTIDADVSELSDTAGLNLAEDFTIHPDPTSSGPVWVTWDESNLYLAADIQDDQHTQAETGNRAIYFGDVLQMGVAPIGADSYNQLNAALTPDGPEVYKEVWPGEGFIGRIDVPAEITRNEDTNHTTYEMAIPWDELTVDHSDVFMQMVLGFRDVDAKSDERFGRQGEYEWGDGMIHGKDASKLRPVKLLAE